MTVKTAKAKIVSDISTHTLTWSVTGVIDELAAIKNHFNSHAHVERDVIYANISSNDEIFQLTRSRGA